MAGRIFVTGDTHGTLDSRKLWQFAAENPSLEKDDFLIVLGDFGYLWTGSEREREQLEELNKLPFTLLVLDGNHENFDLIEKYEEEKWCGGTVQYFSNSVIHLMRGQIYTIAGKTFFVMGGATSIDFVLREIGTSWWEQENINSNQLDEGLKNLAAYNNTVDYVLTHAAPTRFAKEIVENALGHRHYNDVNEMHLEDFRRLPLYFKRWFCGHYHVEYDSGKFTCLYNEIRELE